MKKIQNEYHKRAIQGDIIDLYNSRVKRNNGSFSNGWRDYLLEMLGQSAKGLEFLVEDVTEESFSLYLNPNDRYKAEVLHLRLLPKSGKYDSNEQDLEVYQNFQYEISAYVLDKIKVVGKMRRQFRRIE